MIRRVAITVNVNKMHRSTCLHFSKDPKNESTPKGVVMLCDSFIVSNKSKQKIVLNFVPRILTYALIQRNDRSIR